MESAKRHFRLKVREKLDRLRPPEFAEKSKKLSRLLDRPMQQKKRLLWGVFSPLKDEPQWHVEITGLARFELAYPKFKSKGDMEFRQCRKDELVENQDFGVKILCPPAHSPLVFPQALLVPARGLTKNGERMGRGGGYYDRLLNKFQGLSIGICFAEQLCQELPSTAHDQKVKMVVTDREVINCEA